MTRARDVSAVQNNLGVAIPPAAAGKNAIINGGFDIWQRGTGSFASGSYSADRWYAVVNAGSGTFAQSTATPLPNGSRYFMRGTASGANTNLVIYQALEQATVIPLRGQTVTLSAYIRGTYSGNTSVNITYSNSTDTLTSQTTLVGDITSAVSTSWQRISLTVTVPSDAVGLRVGVGASATPMANTQTIDIWGVQLELGSSATPFSRAGGNIQGELAACMRYYQRVVSGSAYGQIASGEANGTNNLLSSCKFTVPMRAIPTALDTSALSSFRWENGASNGDTPTTLAINNNITTTTSGGFDITKSASFIAGAYYIILGANNTNTYLGWSAEL